MEFEQSVDHYSYHRSPLKPFHPPHVSNMTTTKSLWPTSTTTNQDSNHRRLPLCIHLQLPIWWPTTITLTTTSTTGIYHTDHRQPPLQTPSTTTDHHSIHLWSQIRPPFQPLQPPLITNLSTTDYHSKHHYDHITTLIVVLSTTIIKIIY